MNFQELAQSRHSIRKYTSQPIEEEKKRLLIQAALMAPASKRRNPWEFVMVESKDTILELSGCREHGSQFLAGASLVIVVTADTTKSDLWITDATIAATFIQLQAHDIGLASCWVQIHERMRSETVAAGDYIKGLLSIPENYAILCLIGVGYPDETKLSFDVDKLAYDKIHREKF